MVHHLDVRLLTDRHLLQTVLFDLNIIGEGIEKIKSIILSNRDQRRPHGQSGPARFYGRG
jgi:uncharacterized protein with HEPN domain